MFNLRLYDWSFDGLLRHNLFFHSQEEAENKAREWTRKFIDELLIEDFGDEPEDYGCSSWDEYIEDSINDGCLEEVFDIEEII